MDLIILGGGLSGGLLARKLLRSQPQCKFLILEREATMGGNHTWSFHGSDLPNEDLSWVTDLATGKWSGYSVHFPRFKRKLGSEYFSIPSETFHTTLSKELGDKLLLNQEIKSFGDRWVELPGGKRLEASCVIDATGFGPVGTDPVGWQKFVGLDVRLESPHGLERPVIMDATVLQTDGFRFVYLLPWGSDRVLIEDTYYSGTSDLDIADVTGEIHFYAAQRGWKIAQIERREIGCLPIPLNLAPPIPELGAVPIGVKAGFFHLTTGYSLPDSVRVARGISDAIGAGHCDVASIRQVVKTLARNHHQRNRFFSALNKMLFTAADPESRYKVLERFYRLPEALVQRFYRGDLTWTDCARILIGKPPVPMGRAIQSLFGSGKVV